MIVRKSFILACAAFILMSSLSSCSLITGIFKGGMYFGIILVVIIIVLAIWLISKIGKR